MTRKKRRIIFYSLIALFALAGPLLVLYSLGLTFNFSTAHFDQTGAIFIKSKTPRLSVFLDGAFAKETSVFSGSTLLPDVTPGAHLVRLEKTGFHPWSKTIAVSPAEVTELRNILLAPYPADAATSSREELLAAIQSSTPAVKLTLDPRGRLHEAGTGTTGRVILENVHSYMLADDTIFFVDKNGFLARYDIASAQITSIGRPGFFLTGDRLRFVAGQAYLAIIDPSGGLFLLDENAGTIAPITGGAKNVSFDSTESKLLIQKEQSIAILWLSDNPHQPFEKKGVLEDILSLDHPIREAVWLYKTDSHIVWRDRNGISLTETDRRGGANTAELVPGPADELHTFPGLPDTVFTRIGKTIYKIEL